MKICILSDSHDHHDLLKQAVAEAKTAGAEVILHCGDIVAAKTLKAILPYELPIYVIHGNNMGDNHAMTKLSQRSEGLLRYHGMDAGITLADKRIFMVHYPHYAEAMAVTGNWDLVCCGHSHEALIETYDTIKGTKTELINPGTVGGVEAPATYVMGDLAEMSFTIKTLS